MSLPASTALSRSQGSAAKINWRRSAPSCGRARSSRDKTFSAIRWCILATGIAMFGKTKSLSACAQISSSIPEDANSTSNTRPCGLEPSGASLAVANRFVVSCSTVANGCRPSLCKRCTRLSASLSFETAIARSRSRVNLGSVRTDTASPPTKAQACDCLSRKVFRRNCG